MYLETSYSVAADKFHETVELPWKLSFLSLLRSTYLEDLVDETSISFSKKHSDFIRKHWRDLSELTLIDPFRLGMLLDILERVSEVEGDIVECGCYKGGSGILMGLWLKTNKINKKIHLLDSFAGLPKPDGTNDKGYKEGQFTSDYQSVLHQIERNGLEDIIEVHKGWFSETVPEVKKRLEGIALLHIDCDLYESTNDCLPDFYPSVSERGTIVLDDMNDGGGGEKKAVHEFLEQHDIQEVIQLSAASQAFIIKGANAQNCLRVGKQLYAYDILKENLPYLKWMKENLSLDFIKNIEDAIEL